MNLLQFCIPSYARPGYDPNEPRVPAGNPHGGEWTGEGSSAASGAPGAIYAANKPPGIGHNQGPPLDEPPKIPPRPPGTLQAINDFIKAAAYFLARLPKDPRAALFFVALLATKWLAGKALAYIKAYLDPPKTWEQLQQDALNPQPGYDIHHPVEQTPARKEGFSENDIDAPTNRLRIPTLKHWQINGWYGRKNPEYKDANGNIVSPREYLRGKSWEERLRVAKEALITFGVLKP